jgi:hypothetical protein
MAYPNNSFEQLQLEVDQYGGANPTTFNKDAWTFITGLVRSVSKVVLGSVVPQTYATATLTVQESVVVGDVVAVDVTRDATDATTLQPIAWVGKYSTIVTASGDPKVCGVVLSAASVGGKAVIAVGGVIPRSISGIASITAGALVAADATTSRLRAWVAGDDGLGYATPAGNVVWLYSGRVV